MPVTARDVARFKGQQRFAMLTAWDFPTARLIDEAGVPVILTGDTMAMTVLGYETTLGLTLDELLPRVAAVVRAAENALVVGDMPFGTYEASMEQAVLTAVRFFKEAGVGAIKFEGPDTDLVRALTTAGMPVMGHLGLTPQSVHAIGGFRVQGRGEKAAQRLLEQALAMEEAGVFALVLEAVPSKVAERITRAIAIPTIGIGAGPHCDGQVMVTADMLGLWTGRNARYVKVYADVRSRIDAALQEAMADVAEGRYGT
jgi:3-methyl-2-oxobutanoate hydroxymethyltransferase